MLTYLYVLLLYVQLPFNAVEVKADYAVYSAILDYSFPNGTVAVADVTNEQLVQTFHFKNPMAYIFKPKRMKAVLTPNWRPFMWAVGEQKQRPIRLKSAFQTNGQVVLHTSKAPQNPNSFRRYVTLSSVYRSADGLKAVCSVSADGREGGFEAILFLEKHTRWQVVAEGIISLTHVTQCEEYYPDERPNIPIPPEQP